MGFRSRTFRPVTVLGRIAQSLFFLFFLVMGVGAGAGIATSIYHYWQQRSWTPTPCTILQSQLARPTTGKSSYSVQLRYSYQVAGRQYTGNQLATAGNDFDKYRLADEATRRYPADSAATCLVNPANPREAILERGSLGFAFTEIIPLIFVGIGIGGIYCTWRPARQRAADVVNITGPTALATGAVPGGQGLRPAPEPAHAAVPAATNHDRDSGPGTQVTGRPISDRRNKARGTSLLVFGFFLAFGSLFPYQFVIRPYLSARAAQSWVAVPCTILHSAIHTESDSDGPTYRMDVLYQYDFAGRTYQSDEFDTSGNISTDSYARYQRLAQQYPAGTQRTCYVNPNLPTQAVLMRQSNIPGWIDLLTFLFPAIGLTGLIVTTRSILRQRRLGQSGLAAPISKSRQSRRLLGDPGSTTEPLWEGDSSPSSALEFQPQPRADDGATPGGGPVTLKRSSSSVGGLVFLVIFAAIWNGVVFTIFYSSFAGAWPHSIPGTGWFSGLMALFGVPFVLVGLGLVVLVAYVFLSLFNPRSQVTVSRARVPLGQEMEVTWQFTGNVGRLRNLTISLEGTEIATYQRGSSTMTDKNVFARIEMARITDPRGFARGHGTIRIPPDIMHSFKTRNNEIKWELCIDGDIPRWPDVQDRFEVTVLPLPASSTPASATATQLSPDSEVTP